MNETKARLIELLDRAYADQQAFVATLSEADRSAVGTLKQWAIKDAISHSAFWQRVSVERIAAIVQGNEPPNFDDYLPINDAHFEAHRDRSWAATLAEAREAHRALVAQTESLSEEDLTDPQRFAHAKGRALARSIISNGFWHPEAHLAQLYVEQGEVERANQLQEEVTTMMEAIPEERRAARYNLACFYAISGQKARALAELATALKLNPDLVEWSKQDSDLDSLRDDPAYQALYQPA
jgi:tetratricopeptide (TPR) repeat protein